MLLTDVLLSTRSPSEFILGAFIILCSGIEDFLKVLIMLSCKEPTTCSTVYYYIQNEAIWLSKVLAVYFYST